MIKHILLKKFCEITGYTEQAIRKKINRGEWVEGVHFSRSGDSKIKVNIERYERWCQGESALEATR